MKNSNRKFWEREEIRKRFEKKERNFREEKINLIRTLKSILDSRGIITLGICLIWRYDVGGVSDFRRGLS